MECQDARLLLAFNDRPSDALDPVEGQALQLHLETCQDCATAAAQQRADLVVEQTLAQLMRDVPAPSALAAKIKSRLTADRPSQWKKPLCAAMAAAALIAITSGTVLYINRPTETTIDAIAAHDRVGAGWTAEAVEAYFEKHGIEMRSPRNFDYDFLRRVEIVEFQKRRVAKLTFERDQTNQGSVMVLPLRNFRIPSLPDDGILEGTLRILVEDGYAYVVVMQHGGSIDGLRKDLN